MVERLEIIVEADVGFTLAEIRKLLKGWFGSVSERHEQRAMFTNKISEIDSKMEQLKRVRRRLETVVNEWGTTDC